MVIRRVGVWSVAKLYGGMLAGMGLLFGLIFAPVSLLGVGNVFSGIFGGIEVEAS